MKKKILFILSMFLFLYQKSFSQCPSSATTSANGCIYLVWSTPPSPLPLINGFTYDSGAGTIASPAEYRPGGGCGANQGGFTGSFTISGGPTCTYNAGVLPIHLKSITAYDKNNFVVISWTTLSESNNDVQIVERSLDGKTNWTEVGKVLGTNSNKETSYVINDTKPLAISHYRLRSVDYDGKEQLSKILLVRKNVKETEDILSIYPNPTHNFTNIDLNATADGNLQITIRDITGKVLRSNIYYISEGINTLQIPMEDIPSGMHFLSLQCASIQHHGKIIKE